MAIIKNVHGFLNSNIAKINSCATPKKFNGTNRFYSGATSDGAHLVDNFLTIDGWTEELVGGSAGDASAVTFDGRSCVKLDGGATQSANSRVTLTKTGFSYGNRVTVTFSLYLDTSGDSLQSAYITFNNQDKGLFCRFNTDLGLTPINYSTGQYEDLNIEIALDTWNTFTFDVDFPNNTTDIYMNGNLVVDNRACLLPTLATYNGRFQLAQWQYSTSNKISYWDWIRIGNTII